MTKHIPTYIAPATKHLQQRHFGERRNPEILSGWRIGVRHDGMQGFPVRFKNIFLLLSLMFILCLSASATAGERDTRRAWVGLDLFPSLLAADMDIGNKTDASGELLILLVYRDDPVLARDMAGRILGIGRIRDIPLRVETIRINDIDPIKALAPAGIFLVQKAGERFKDLVDVSTNQGIVLFSPFEGDVEAGATAGILVADRVAPYVNLRTVQASGLHIKPFFMRVAVVYP